MKKNKLRKKILILSTFGIASAFSVCTGVGLLNVSISNTNTDKDIKKVGTSLNALDNSSTTTNQSKATFSVNKAPTTILNKTADKVLNSDIEAILTPSTTITNFSVVILPITQKNINEGYVNFLVFETYQIGDTYKTELADASKSKDNDSSSGNYKSDDKINNSILAKYANSSSSVSDTNVFSTKKITSLSSVGDNKEPWITPEKYNLSWASDDYLKQYITNKTTDLTPEDVWNNFFSENNYLPPLKTTTTDSKDSSSNSDQYTEIKVSKVDANGTISDSNTGIYKVEISIYNTTKNSWTYEPTTFTSSSSSYTITKYFGGFLKSDGTRDNISINIEQSIGSWTIPNLSTFYYGSSGTKTVNSLSASEFINPVGGTSALISMFDSGTGLKKNSSDGNSTPIITYKFNGTPYNFYNSSNDNSSSDSSTNNQGILGEIQKNKKNIKITNIQAIPDDTTGSLKLIFYYNGYSIYSDSVVSQIYTYTYPAGTFAASSNPDQNSIFTWKNINTLSDDGLSTSYDIVNEFNKNKDNVEFVRLFTNQFLDASSDILEMPRTAIITYGTDTTKISDPTISSSTNDYSSDTSSTSICIQLTFNNWSKQEKSKTFVTSYTFPNYKYTYNSTDSSKKTDDSLTLSWKTSNDVIKENPSYAATSPSEIVYNLLSSTSSGSNSYTKFFTGTSLNSSQLAVSYLPDNTNGTILVYVSRRTDQNSGSSDSSTSQLNAHVYSQLFVGFKKSASSGGIMSYSWLPQDDVSLELLSIPLSRVTKADVMKYYLDNISLFKDRTLTEDDVEIIPDISSSSLTVKVTINDFNKDDISITSSNQTFLTKITGFVSSTHTNDTVFSPPKNLTAVISVSAATLISVTLGIVLCGMLIRRARIRDFKGYHGSVLNGDKQKKENKNKKKKII